MTLDLKTIRTELKRVIPRFTITSIRRKGGGALNHIVEVNGEWIVRVPKNGGPPDAVERSVLQALAGRTTLNIPRLVGAGRSPRFSIYRKIPGVPLTAGRWNTLTPKEKSQVVVDVAGFFAEVHRTLSIPQARRLGVKSIKDSFQWNRPWEKRLQASEEGGRLIRLAQRQLKAYRAYRKRHPLTSFLLLDASPANVLWSTRKRRISGVVDFGGSAIGDVHLEFLPWFLFDPRACSALIQRYRAVGPFPVSMKQVRRLMILHWMRELAFSAETPESLAFQNARSHLTALQK